jgi:hypothetical protein
MRITLGALLGILLGMWLTISGLSLLLGIFMLGFPLPAFGSLDGMWLYLPWLLFAGVLVISLIVRAPSRD